MIEGCLNLGDQRFPKLPEVVAARNEKGFERTDIRARDALQQEAPFSDVVPLECGES